MHNFPFSAPKAIPFPLSEETSSKLQYANRLRNGLKTAFKLHRLQQTQNQYSENFDMSMKPSGEEFISRLQKSKRFRPHKDHSKVQGHLQRPGSSSSFRHHLPFLGFGLSSPTSENSDSYNNNNNYANVNDEVEDDEAQDNGMPLYSFSSNEDPHFYQERYKSNGNQGKEQSQNHPIVLNDGNDEQMDDEISEELFKMENGGNGNQKKVSLVNSYFDNEYSLSQLHKMECVTPTKSKGAFLT